MNETSSNLSAAVERGLVSLTEQAVFWLPRAAIAIVVVIVTLWLGRRLARLAGHPFRAATLTVRRFIERVTELGVVILGFALALNVLGLGAFAAGILASGSILAIVLGFAFQQIGTNLIAGVFLAFDRPFKVGDIIECDGFQGVVRALDLRSTHIRNFDGRDIFIPNATIFINTLINFTIDDLRRRAFSVGIRYEDDASEAMAVLQRAASGIPGVLTEPGPAVAITELAESTVRLEISYWVSMQDPIQVRAQTGAEVMDRCRRALLEHGYTVSANVTTDVELAGSPSPQAVQVVLGRSAVS
jgi:small-conductance mechanosensitive channel